MVNQQYISPLKLATLHINLKSANHLITQGNNSEIGGYMTYTTQYHSQQNIHLSSCIDISKYTLSKENTLTLSSPISAMLDPEQFLSSTSDDSSKALSWQQKLKQNEMQDDICRNR